MADIMSWIKLVIIDLFIKTEIKKIMMRLKIYTCAV